MDLIIQWIDLLWLPLVLVCVYPPQRFWAAGFVLAGMVMWRLQAELVASTGYAHGFLGLLDLDLRSKGLLSYGVFNVLYLILAIYSPATKGSIFMAATLSLFFMAFCVSMFIMVL